MYSWYMFILVYTYINNIKQKKNLLLVGNVLDQVDHTVGVSHLVIVLKKILERGRGWGEGRGEGGEEEEERGGGEEEERGGKERGLPMR